MLVTLELSDSVNSHVIKNLWPLYQHDLSQFDRTKPNIHGLFGVDKNIRTLAQHAELQNRWWQEPNNLFPYIIFADGQPAGFSLIAGKNALPPDIDADFVVHEFFILHFYRARNIATQAAIQSFRKHLGKWEIVTSPANERAIGFWKKATRDFVPENYLPNLVNHHWGQKVCFQFNVNRR